MHGHPLREQLHQALGADLAAGAALSTGVAARCWVVLAGAARYRVRLKATAAGTLAVKYSHPNRPSTRGVYAAGEVYDTNPATVPVSANVEAVLDVAEHFGEHGAWVEFTPSGNGVVTWADIMRT